MEKTVSKKRHKENVITFRVNAQTYNKLLEKADETQCSVSEVIRDAIKIFLTEK